jgi:hypothetical protein
MAQVAPFSSDLPEHFFLEFVAGRGGNVTTSFPACWLLLLGPIRSTLVMVENEPVVADCGGPELRELSGLTFSLNGFGGSGFARYAGVATGRSICSETP